MLRKIGLWYSCFDGKGIDWESIRQPYLDRVADAEGKPIVAQIAPGSDAEAKGVLPGLLGPAHVIDTSPRKRLQYRHLEFASSPTAHLCMRNAKRSLPGCLPMAR